MHLLGPDYASMDLRVGRKMNLGGRFHLELTAESFNLFNRDNKRYGVSDNGFYNSAGQFVKYTQYGGRSLLSGLLSATYKFYEADELVCSATDAIVDAVEFLRLSEDFCTFHLT